MAILLGVAPFVAFELLCSAFDWGNTAQCGDPFVGFRSVRPLFELNADGSCYQVAKCRQRFFRPESFAAQKAPNEFRVFCIGGSTVQGEPYGIETSFTTWLEIALNAADPSRQYQVVNCGGLSYATYRLVPIVEEVLTYQPDLIIFCEGHNEFLEHREFAHVQNRGRLLNAAIETASRIRSVNVARQGYLALFGTADESVPRTILPTEVEALLDYRGGIDEYHRDDQQFAGVVAEFRLNIETVVEQTRAAGVELLLLNPVSNLADSPPFKCEHSADMSLAELDQWELACDEARTLLHAQPPRVQSATRLFELACRLDPQHAGGFYNLGKCYEMLGEYTKAREAYLKARDLDVCPLRAPQAIGDAMLEVADRSGTPLFDAQQFFREHSRHGIESGEWLVDHVHPSIEGHQLLAEALAQKLIALGYVHPRSDWEAVARERNRVHLASLGGPYFYNAGIRLNNLQGWAQGRVKRLRSPTFDTLAEPQRREVNATP